MSTATDPRTIDPGLPPERFARGWHCLGVAETFRDGEPHAVPAFGGKLVVFADTAGEIAVLDGYCRHMGGDLTQGTVKGDAIACPFHDWRWGGDGKCKAIPYARRIPLRARTRAYPTVVRNGLLLVWHDPEGSPADHDVLPPELADIEDPDVYTDWTWSTLDVPSAHCREIMDNVVDMAHFFYIHFAFPTNFRNVFEGHQATQYMESTGRPDMAGQGYGDESLVLKSEATYYGPSFMINWLATDYKGFLTEVVLVNCHVPTSDNSFVLQYGLKVRKPEGVDEKTSRYIGDRYTQMFGEGFLQDVHIWLNKAPVMNPLLCEEDGPVYQLRRWYEQFYVDRADVTPEMTERFEFEVDTSKANEFWRAEVEENLARKADEDAASESGTSVAEPVESSLMGSFAPLSHETAEDQQRYLDARLTDVACLDCLATVRVKKNSEHHTSVQWTVEALGECQEFARMSRLPEGRPMHAACPRLMASIDRAVREGDLEVGAVDGY